MRLPPRPREGLQFNITPLIDVVFLLIIFFLAASHFSRSETAEAVELPSGSQFDDPSEEVPTPKLVITITVGERMFVGSDVFDLAGIKQRIGIGQAEYGSAFEVRIRTDQNVPYRLVEPIMLHCARSGIRNVKFAVIKGER